VGKSVVSSVCSCGEIMHFTSYDEPNEMVEVICLPCGRRWLQKRTDRGWIKVPMSETPEAKSPTGDSVQEGPSRLMESPSGAMEPAPVRVPPIF
jgi:hypothetical protein